MGKILSLAPIGAFGSSLASNQCFGYKKNSDMIYQIEGNKPQKIGLIK